MVLCPGLPGWAGTRKVKPIWIYFSKWQWVAGPGLRFDENKTARAPHGIHWFRCLWGMYLSEESHWQPCWCSARRRQERGCNWASEVLVHTAHHYGPHSQSLALEPTCSLSPASTCKSNERAIIPILLHYNCDHFNGHFSHSSGLDSDTNNDKETYGLRRLVTLEMDALPDA